jgi:hypothetical protein
MEIHRLETDNSQDLGPEKSSCRLERWLDSYRLQNVTIHHLGVGCAVPRRIPDARQSLSCTSGREFGADRLRPAQSTRSVIMPALLEDRSDLRVVVDRVYVLDGLVEVSVDNLAGWAA